MVTFNLAFLNMMVVEYNQLINASYIKSAPPDIDCDSLNDLSSSIRSRDRDERDFKLEEIENEMILLLGFIKKRKRDEDVDKKPKKGAKEVNTIPHVHYSPILQLESEKYSHITSACGIRICVESE